MFNLKQHATRLLARALPPLWSCASGYSRAPRLLCVSAFRGPTRCHYAELSAPAPLHLLLRLLLWPLALLDWACALPRDLWGFLPLCWAVPNPSFPWPPLP